MADSNNYLDEATQKKITKYANRFINVCKNIRKKEGVDPDTLIRSLQAALIAEHTSLIIERGALNGNTINELEEVVKEAVHVLNEMYFNYFQYAANQMIEEMRKKEPPLIH